MTGIASFPAALSDHYSPRASLRFEHLGDRHRPTVFANDWSEPNDENVSTIWFRSRRINCAATCWNFSITTTRLVRIHHWARRLLTLNWTRLLSQLDFVVQKLLPFGHDRILEDYITTTFPSQRDMQSIFAEHSKLDSSIPPPPLFRKN